MSAATLKIMSLKEFVALAEERFGPDNMKWQFVCPCCGHVQTGEDYKSAGAPSGAVGFSCVGRWLENRRSCFDSGPGPCDYAGGGLIGMHRLEVEGRACFELAEICTMTEEEQQKAMDELLADAHEDCPIFGPEDFH
jgi:hypothetical protein